MGARQWTARGAKGDREPLPKANGARLCQEEDGVGVCSAVRGNGPSRTCSAAGKKLIGGLGSWERQGPYPAGACSGKTRGRHSRRSPWWN